jgi:hypothetical protein
MRTADVQTAAIDVAPLRRVIGFVLMSALFVSAYRLVMNLLVRALG